MSRVLRTRRKKTGREKTSKNPIRAASQRRTTKAKASGKTRPVKKAAVARKGARKPSPASPPIKKATARAKAKRRRAPSPVAIPLSAGATLAPVEPFMNPRMLEHFRSKLQSCMDEFIREAGEASNALQLDPNEQADEIDRANAIEARNLILRAQERQANLVRKIDAALARIEDGTYGYCEVTGEPIDVRRLEARPIATRSIEAQESWERRESQYADA